MGGHHFYTNYVMYCPMAVFYILGLNQISAFKPKFKTISELAWTPTPDNHVESIRNMGY